MSRKIVAAQLKSKRLTPEVRSWLGDLGLQSVERYAELFADHQMDMDSVRLLTANGLRDMGIHALGPIMKIMKGMRACFMHFQTNETKIKANYCACAYL